MKIKEKERERKAQSDNGFERYHQCGSCKILHHLPRDLEVVILLSRAFNTSFNY